MIGIYETVCSLIGGFNSIPPMANLILEVDVPTLLATVADAAADTASHAGDSHGHGDASLTTNLIFLLIAAILVVLNGFFVAAEFALVKVRPTQVTKMVRDNLAFAKTAEWLTHRMDNSLAACQLGITMASLALGYVGEPAFFSLIKPLFKFTGMGETALHVVAFIIAFSIITALHLVIGEQAPKIFAIREPEKMVRWCALPMKVFYYILFIPMYALNWVTSLILAKLGVDGETGHGAPHSEEDIRAIMKESHLFGHLTQFEHRLINEVFEFDDMVCRYVMVPRNEVEILDVNEPFPKLLEKAKASKFTRYPVCDSSLDSLLGVVHTKDFLGIPPDADFDIKTLMRQPTKVPENMPISDALKHFQTTHQLLTFVIDEYGAIIGIMTLENVLEKIVGPVDDEFDALHQPKIRTVGEGVFIIQGRTHITDVERALGLNLDQKDVDTVAGVLMSRSGKLPEKGDVVEFVGAEAEILEVKNDHAELIRFSIKEVPDAEESSAENSGH